MPTTLPNYEITRSIRLALKEESIKRKANYPVKFSIENLYRAFKKSKDIFNKVVSILFYVDEDKNWEVKEKIKIKSKSLKSSFKTTFYSLNKKDKIVDLRVFQTDLKNWKKETEETINQLETLLEKRSNESARLSVILSLLNVYLSDRNIKFITKIVDQNLLSLESYDQNQINKVKKDFLGDLIGNNGVGILKNLESEKISLQNSINGIYEVERISLNSYTVNKRNKNYKKEIQDSRNKLDSLLLNDYKELNKEEYGFIYWLKTLDKSEKALKMKLEENKKEYKGILSIENIERKITKYGSDIQVSHLTLEELKFCAKEYLRSSKIKFYELLSDSVKKNNEDIDLSKINDICKLFYNENNPGAYKKLISIQEKILVLSNQKSIEKDNSKIIKLKKNLNRYRHDRGKFLMNKSFKLWNDFTEKTKKISMDLGRLKNNLKMIEKEYEDSLIPKSFGVILLDSEDKYLLSIPKDASGNVTEYKKELGNNAKVNTKEKYEICIFESLTLRALHKLCFNEVNNTFMTPLLTKEVANANQDIGDLLNFRWAKDRRKKNKTPDKLFQLRHFVNYIEKNDEYEKFEDNLLLVKFYQEVIKIKDSEKSPIKLWYFGANMTKLINYDYSIYSNEEVLEKFEIDLKKYCYQINKSEISYSDLNKFIEKTKSNLYKFEGYDFEKTRDKEKVYTMLWKQFWANENKDFIIRLNPEIKIIGRNIQKQLRRLDKSGKELDQDRRLKLNYTANMTLTLNSLGKRIEIAYRGEDELKSKIDEFNTEFNISESGKNLKYLYGLDRGEGDGMLTLGIFKTLKNGEYLENIKFDIWKIPEDKYFETKESLREKDNSIRLDEKGNPILLCAYQNPSYFMDVLEKAEVSCVNLGFAKLFTDRTTGEKKIIVNGDISTYAKLIHNNIYRELFEILKDNGWKKPILRYNLGHLDIDFSAVDLTLKVKGLKLPKEFITIKNLDDKACRANFLSELSDYIKELAENKFDRQAEIIENYRLRKAIASNLVGILNYLYQIYPGLICFEGQQLANKNLSSTKRNGSLGSIIEISVLNKFQKTNLVPPFFRNIMLLNNKYAEISDESKSQNAQNKNIVSVNQLGTVYYVDNYKSSNTCPQCPDPIEEKGTGLAGLKANYNHQFCEKCGFSTIQNQYELEKLPDKYKNLLKTNKFNELSFLKNVDDVACYNIAKRGYEYLQTIKNQNV